MNRRNFLESAAALLAVPAALPAEQPEPPRTTMGVVQYSFSHNPHTHSTYEFLDFCHSFGAGGVQVGLDSLDPAYAEKVRRHAAELGMYLEIIVELPKKDGRGNFEQTVAAAKRAGAVAMRAACLGGRRYEVFSSLDQWKQFVADSHARIEHAIPVLEKYRLALGLENHKDWTADELASLLKHYSSEYLGACVDTGNNAALLDSPINLVETLAPFAITTHFKDIAFEEYPEGFMVSEVPLGEGVLDLRRMVALIRRARPRAHFSLEMITRDPLKIPCLTDKYWATFPQRNGRYLADALTRVRDHERSQPLPVISSLSRPEQLKAEEDNVRKCLAFAQSSLGLV
ncbi:MAG TPA: TIM barrel protein [Terriglobia bacterium]|nr:TIM barrel protein [Terriglobia bacterium]